MSASNHSRSSTAVAQSDGKATMVEEPMEDAALSLYNNQPHDVTEMSRLGKRQEFKRNFGYLSTLGFVSIYMATWEYVLVSLSAGFSNGGLAGLFWTFLGTVICYATIVMSLAEMESMAPTSGGQYHWTSEFAPPRYQKFLSYASGWMSSLGWIASVSSGAFVVATLIQAMLDVLKVDFTFKNWQYTLVMLAFLALCICFNSWGARTLPGLQTSSLFAHFIGWGLTIVAIVAACPKNNPKEVFVHVVSQSGWENVGVACLISQVSVIYCNLGSDSIVHISEEVPNASIVVPRCMFWSYIFNTILGIAMLIAMLYGIGPLDAAIVADAPYIVLFANTGLIPLAFVLVFVLFILIFIGNVTALATATREVWAFARDKGFPRSRWIAHMDHEKNVPTNAVYLTSVLAGVLCFVNIGSTMAFEIIVSLTLLGILSTYKLSIGCLIYRRLTDPGSLPPARWSLGRFGLPINIFAFLYSGFVMVFACFPAEKPVTLGNANWAPLVWVGVIVVAGVAYGVHGQKHYTPPADFVLGRRKPGQGLQGVD